MVKLLNGPGPISVEHWPNQETEIVGSMCEGELTVGDVKGALMKNIPPLPEIYKRLLMCAIGNIQWEFVDKMINCQKNTQNTQDKQKYYG